MFAYNRTKYKRVNALGKEKVYTHHCKYATRNWSQRLSTSKEASTCPQKRDDSIVFREEGSMVVALYFFQLDSKLCKVIQVQQELERKQTTEESTRSVLEQQAGRRTRLYHRNT
jgi:hypothetical protein